jgi:hypothetical protein
MLKHRYLCDIIADIDASGCGEDALVSYVKGVCLNKQGAKRAAMAALAHSVTVFPLNWSAWMEMLTISKKVAWRWRGGCCRKLGADACCSTGV